MNGQNRMFALKEMWGDRIALYLRNVYTIDGVPKEYIAEPIRLRATTAADEGIAPAPMLTLRPEEAQTLMDQLWDCGLRPSEGTGSAGALAATQSHLNDMRRIVEHNLKMTNGLAK